MNEALICKQYIGGDERQTYFVRLPDTGTLITIGSDIGAYGRAMEILIALNTKATYVESSS